MRRPLFGFIGIIVVASASLLAGGSAAQDGPTRRVAVVALGDDLARVASLQSTLGTGLEREEGLIVSPLLRVADRIGVAGSGSTVPVADIARVKAIKGRIEEAYYTDELADVFRAIDELEALVRRHPFGLAAERETIHLWRTAAHMSSEDQAKAERSARELLQVSPSVQVDMNVFTPTMARTVESIRKTGLQTARLRVSAPQGASVLLDGRALGSGDVPLGKHWLVWTRKGLRTVEREVDVRGDTFIKVPNALQLSPTVVRGLETVVWRGKIGSKQRGGVRAIADALEVDVLVLAATRSAPTPEFRAYVWDRSAQRGLASPPMAATSEGARALGDFVSKRLRTDRARPTPTPVGGADPRRPTRVVVAARAGAGITSRARSVSDGNSAFDGRYVGAGPAATVDVSRGAIIGNVTARTIFFGLAPVRVDDPDDPNAKVDIGGGFTLRADVAGGYRFEFGSERREQRSSVAGLLAGYYEQHDAKDVVAAGIESGLFPSYTRFGVGARAVGRVPVGDQIMVSGALQYNPLRGHDEKPARSGDVKLGLDLGWGAAVDWSPSDQWAVSAVYDGQRRTLSYEGTSGIPVTPPLVDAERTETFHTFAVVGSWTF